ncbi:MAG: PIN domain-containing protein [Ruminococcus sp.]|jgi:predicted nucleic acid-binding protein|nr:PIN domain-containing protein [Ruminococcus sp.]
MNQKPKVYLDTSVISHLFQDEKPEAQGYTIEFWEKIKGGEFEVFISRIVFEEMKKAPKDKYDLMKTELEKIAYNDIYISDEILELSAEIISMGILPPKSVNDSIHIAAALIGECDYLATWNMKHLANVKTNEGVRSVVLKDDLKQLMLLTPNMFLGGA